MCSPQFRLSCDTFKSGICNGLSSLQQQEEFVDMTLAADGHFVKVHQIIVSLASSYLKELILSAPCPHPVVFLNKVSYPILCAILEYIYSGEVMVNKETLPELIAVGQELHIKGLQDMVLPVEASVEHIREETHSKGLVERLQQIKSKTISQGGTSDPKHGQPYHIEVSLEENMDDPFADSGKEEYLRDSDDDIDEDSLQTTVTKSKQNPVSLTYAPPQINSATASKFCPKTVQYTLSNQGSLQLILNRFIYYLRYCHKNSKPPVRLWRCVEYIRNRCPASVTTKDDVVIKRVSAHKHGFHDTKIMKKLEDGTIFTAIKDAESKGLEQKNKLTIPNTTAYK